MKRAKHHWHVVLDYQGNPTQGVIEHEHQVNPDRRHAHYYDFASAHRSLLEQGLGAMEAEGLARILEGRPEGTLDLDRPPTPAQDEARDVARLHPEVRRSLS